MVETLHATSLQGFGNRIKRGYIIRILYTPNPGLLPLFSGACSHLVETFRRFALAQLGVSLAWCAAANVSTTDRKGGYISRFGLTSCLGDV
jgi:hypothetical protein